MDEFDYIDRATELLEEVATGNYQIPAELRKEIVHLLAHSKSMLVTVALEQVRADG